jgi:hypothetical protein
LELFDSGLLPEKMRERRAAANNVTLYEMVRDEKLYPLEKYLDAADLALLRDRRNLETFAGWLSDSDEGMRWWAITGLHLLENEASPATDVMEQTLDDESHEVRMMAAWSLVKLGKPDRALDCLDELLFDETTNETMLHNVLDWMGEPALPLVKKYIEQGGTAKGRYGIGILGRIAELSIVRTITVCSWVRRCNSIVEVVRHTECAIAASFRLWRCVRSRSSAE